MTTPSPSADPGTESGPSKSGWPRFAPKSRRRHPRRRVGAIVVTIIVVAATLTTVVVLLRTGCALGTEVGLFNVTAPQMVVNIPQNGTGGMFQNAANWTVSSGSLTLGGLPTQEPGSGDGWAALRGTGLNIVARQPFFAVYSVRNTTELSTSARPCSQPYVAEAVGFGYCGGFAFPGLPIPNPANDSLEPHVLNWSCPGVQPSSGVESGGYMWFDTAFPTSSTNGASSEITTLDLCNWTTNFTHYAWGEVGIPFVLHVPHAGTEISVQGYVNWESWNGGNLSSALYILPHGAIWRVAVIGEYSLNYPGILPPGLLAFQRLSC